MKDPLTWLCVALIVIALGWVERDKWLPQKPPEAVAAAPAPAPVRHLAPEGTFYVVEYLSTHTPHGIAGFVPGQEVHFVSANQAKGTLLVTDGKYQIEANPVQLTNDLDVAEMARRQDQDSQRQLQAMQTAAAKADAEFHRKIDIEHAKDVARVGSGAKVGAGGALDQQAQAASSLDRARQRGVSSGSPYSYLHQGYYAPGSTGIVGGGG